ncbi:amidohydrolase [Longibacter salinarum]|uniref:Amidohydrolase n=1 Tax=Longibacter salinarum TaxID=1850348 RepID=A0A2A8CZ28_9BACT|nr:amidohydrolase family protein [Longibacter salinarum]PEN13945.1 amidohydrolase [Longibacter salinarum]
MSRSIQHRSLYSLTRRALVGLLLFLFVSFCAMSAHAQVAVMADTVYTMAGAPIVDGVVLANGRTIEAVGPVSDIDIPDDYRQIEATVVTPGLIDARSTVGLSGIDNVEADQMQLETSSPMQPELRAIDAYNARDELVNWVRSLGVTTVHTGHGPGATISGQTMVVKTNGRTIDEALVDSTAMLAMTIGPSVSRNFDSPGTRAKAIAMLRQKLIEAQQYREKRAGDNPPTRDLGMEVLVGVLDGDIPALVTAHRARDIMTAIRLKEEFGFELVIDGGAESYLVKDKIKAEDVPVIVHPPMMRTYGAGENAAFTTPGELHEAGIPIAFQSGYEAYVPKTRVALFEAAVAVANGLPREAGLRALTIDAAELLGLSDQIGSIEEGKHADLVLYSGDPFEYTTQVCTVIIDGRVASSECQ